MVTKDLIEGYSSGLCFVYTLSLGTSQNLSWIRRSRGNEIFQNKNSGHPPSPLKSEAAHCFFLKLLVANLHLQCKEYTLQQGWQQISLELKYLIKAYSSIIVEIK